uniref:WD_REPEATS_REGION domain-containing protein n=1 Tax=Rhabditophanes sp. KR3021 TaxID=114890 RepID=A0AC35TG51_9BILA
MGNKTVFHNSVSNETIKTWDTSKASNASKSKVSKPPPSKVAILISADHNYETFSKVSASTKNITKAKSTEKDTKILALEVANLRKKKEDYTETQSFEEVLEKTLHPNTRGGRITRGR